MSFHSFDYVAFFGLVVAFYWCLPHRAQNVLLLAASYVFYGWIHPWFLIPIAFSTMVDYSAGLLMERDPARKKLWFGASLATNLGLLGTFKYFNFFVDNVSAVLRAVGLDVPHVALRLVLPVGISFYTFQSMSYTIDIYRGHVKARRHLLDFALFVCFFPQLVAGPIERATRLLPQMEHPRRFSPQLAREASLLMLWGFFKKLVIADNVGTVANKVFGLEDPGFFVLWAGVFAFGMQIYADFSAYSDIARGSARWLGFDLMRNFDHPYIATNPVDFWRRWHIALSSWFRDYVYIPLGGSRCSRWLNVRNILITFGLSGLWHGAHWNYVRWGLFHGVLVAGWHLATTRSPALESGGGKAGHLARVAATFVLVHIGWLMFREESLAQLGRALTLSPFTAPREVWEAGLFLAAQAMLFSLPMWVFPLAQRLAGPEGSRLPAPPTWRRTLMEAALAALLLAGILVYSSPSASDFIYFQF